MSIEVENSVIIKQPLAFVWDYTSDLLKTPDWNHSILTVRWFTTKPLVQGSEFDVTAKLLGNKVAYRLRVMELIPQQHMVLRPQDSPVYFQTTYSWASLGNKVTQFTLRNETELSGAMKLMAPILRGQLNGAMKADLNRLKEILESRNSS